MKIYHKVYSPTEPNLVQVPTTQSPKAAALSVTYDPAARGPGDCQCSDCDAQSYCRDHTSDLAPQRCTSCRRSCCGLTNVVAKPSAMPLRTLVDLPPTGVPSHTTPPSPTPSEPSKLESLQPVLRPSRVSAPPNPANPAKCGSLDCVQTNELCAQWSRSGECERNPAFMYDPRATCL